MTLYRKRMARAALERGLLLALVLTVAAALAAERLGRYRAVSQAVRADTLRLHVLANSDTLADQLAKLRARDAVLAELGPLLAQADSEPGAEALVQSALPRLAAAARRAARQPAVVRLQRGRYPARDYGSFALPEGEYTALRVELGAAEGHNWFCVLYPALCLGTAGAQYPTPEENSLVFGRWAVRFALWDCLTRAR